MKLAQILQNYDTVALDQISTDKVDEVLNLRLPQSVIIQEIISALNSQSYISKKILYAKPPTFAILSLILQSPEHMVEVEGFRDLVLKYTRELANKVGQIKGTPEKNTGLYIKILRKAWENDDLIDKNEAHILELVKQELGIWEREHFILMHDDSILGLWNLEEEYYIARNQLVSSGVILTTDTKYVMAEEVVVQVRRAFGIEIMDDACKRLLGNFNKEELAQILSYYQFNVSGSKETLIDRLLTSFIPPPDVLNQVNLERLREMCRRQGISVTGAKNIVIAKIIQFFDDGNDLIPELVHQTAPTVLPSELREMSPEIYSKVLSNLTGQQLYDILYQGGFMTSGSKEEKIKRVTESHLAERSVFNFLRKEDLVQLCRRFVLPVSGSKPELVDRLLDYLPTEPAIEKKEPNAEKIEINTVTTKVEIPGLPDTLLMPANWEEINKSFPDLDNAEKVILAILREAKSISEQEVERIVKKYKLGWFLYKAEMAELIAKLKRNKHYIIEIKSVQNSNIYQWIANENTDEKVVEKKSARDIIDALRHGVVPRNNLGRLVVGQQTARKHLSEILFEINSNKSHFKFIRGQYGSGKTFICSWLKEFALENEFAVSFMNISHDQPLSDLAIFFSGVISGLRTPEKSDSSALVDILESWLLNIHNRTATLEGISNKNADDLSLLSQAVQKSIEIELTNFNDIEPGFSQALRSFYEAKIQGNSELASNAVAWITGSRSLSSQALRDIGVKGYLESNNVFPRMRALLQIIGGARYKGLLLLVDELELVRKFPHARQREQALETLRLLIDEAGRNALPGCLVIFTGTDEFFEDERYGLKSYEALAERVITPFIHESFVSMRQPIIKLESLNSDRLSYVIFKIRDLYGTAYNWDSKQYADDESIIKLIEEWTVFGKESIDRKPRPILREFIQMLDLCEENKGVDISQFLKKSNITTLLDSSLTEN